MILAASLCDFDKLILTGSKTRIIPSCLLRLTGEPKVAAPVPTTTTRKKGKAAKAKEAAKPIVEVASIKVISPEGIPALQRNDAGLAFSIGLAEYAVALYMLKTLADADIRPEVTVVTPNTLQRDLVRDVFAKKRVASSIFT